MNEEHDLARKITQHLDYGTVNLESRLQYRLQAARQHALEAYTKPHHSFSLAGISHGHSSTRGHSPSRTWVTLALVLLGLMFVTYLQNTPDMNDVSEIDTLLLGGDLPLHAFIDNGFDTWLEGSSQE